VAFPDVLDKSFYNGYTIFKTIYKLKEARFRVWCSFLFPNRDSVLERTLKTGTTTVGMIVDNSIILATDTRVTSGFFVAHRRGKKVHQLSKWIAITIAGRVADAQALIDLLKANINYYEITRNEQINVLTVARFAQNYMFRSRYFPYIAQLIIGGIDNQGPHLYNIDPLGSVTEEKVIATGSGSPVALGVLEPVYSDNLSFDDAVKLAFKAVAASIRRDAGSGDSIDVAYIKPETGYRELTLDEKIPLYKEYLRYAPV